MNRLVPKAPSCYPASCVATHTTFGLARPQCFCSHHHTSPLIEGAEFHGTSCTGSPQAREVLAILAMHSQRGSSASGRPQGALRGADRLPHLVEHRVVADAARTETGNERVATWLAGRFTPRPSSGCGSGTRSDAYRWRPWRGSTASV